MPRPVSPLKSLLLVLILFIAGCDGMGTASSRVVAGVDMDELFAPPTQADIDAQLAEWAGRDVSAQDAEVLATQTIDVTDTQRLVVRIVRHVVGGVRHVGAVVTPEGATGPLPVLVYGHGGNEGENLDLTISIFRLGFPTLIDQFVYVVPAFRSETLRFNGSTYRAEGTESPWDFDVDDALALLNVALEITPEADPERIAALGFSRGAAVALLMAIRDPRIDLVVDYFGPTDFYAPSAQDIVEEGLRGRVVDLPGFRYINATFIQPLRNNEIDISTARKEVLRRSAVMFADRLPDVLINHGENDIVVPVEHAESLIAAMEAEGRTEPSFQYVLYPGAGHNPLEMPESFDVTTTFLTPLTVAPSLLYSP